jgi:hypothetical protein
MWKRIFTENIIFNDPAISENNIFNAGFYQCTYVLTIAVLAVEKNTNKNTFIFFKFPSTELIGMFSGQGRRCLKYVLYMYVSLNFAEKN